MNMNNEKSISECYEEIRQREIEELKKKVLGRGGKYEFDEDCDAPEVLCDLKYEGPVDVMITSVSVDDRGFLSITGKIHYDTGFGESYGLDNGIAVSDIAYGGLSVICEAIPKVKDIVLTDDMRRFSETVAELSNLMYTELYEKYGDSFAVLQEIIELSIKFESNFVPSHDFLVEIDEYAKKCLEKI